MRQRQIQEDESIGLRTKTRCPPWCLRGQRDGCSAPELPEEIWCHLHSLLPMRDAARFACVSRDFLRSWRFLPNLTFNKQTLGINKNKCQIEQMRDFINIVDNVLKNHSGIGVKTLKLNLGVGYDKDYCYLDSWLQIVKAGIEELELRVSTIFTLYNFPMSVLSGGIEASLRSLVLSECKFQPSDGSICFKRLTTLQLNLVDIKDDELSYLLSCTPALERLNIMGCYKLICIKIPCLQQLNYLGVSLKPSVQVIESKAPNISSLYFEGELNAQLPLEGTQQIKELSVIASNAMFNACTELPSTMPNLETLMIHSFLEEVNTPVPPSKFHRLKLLNTFVICGSAYDFLSLVSFLHACPSLETFVLNIRLQDMDWVSIFSDPSDMRTMPVYRHDKLKCVRIDTFSYVKKYIEFVCHVLEFATSLEQLTLDTVYGAPRCSVSETRKCRLMTKERVMSARKSALAIERYIKPKAPTTVEINVLGPCSRCHAAVL